MRENMIFVTGGNGFLGSALVNRLRRTRMSATLLSRTPMPELSEDTGGLINVVGDLSRPQTYRSALQQCGTVVHLAARTGKAKKQAHFADNLETTETLLDESRQAGVSRFLFVSTIAVQYPDIRYYYYAQAKARAELAVQRSTLRHTIVRPTMILGRDSSILSTLQRLARFTPIPVFGGGQTRVQPIFVDDVADILVDLVTGDQFDGEILELGGPEVCSMNAFLDIIRACQGLEATRTIHLPLTITAEGIGLLEMILGPGPLPFTAGQLSLFRFDSTAAVNPMWEQRRNGLKTIDQMLELSIPKTA